MGVSGLFLQKPSVYLYQVIVHTFLTLLPLSMVIPVRFAIQYDLIRLDSRSCFRGWVSQPTDASNTAPAVIQTETETETELAPQHDATKVPNYKRRMATKTMKKPRNGNRSKIEKQMLIAYLQRAALLCRRHDTHADTRKHCFPFSQLRKGALIRNFGLTTLLKARREKSAFLSFFLSSGGADIYVPLQLNVCLI